MHFVATLASRSDRLSSTASKDNAGKETKRVAGEMAIWAARLAAVRDGSYEMQRMKEQQAWRVFREKHDRWAEDMCLGGRADRVCRPGSSLLKA